MTRLDPENGSGPQLTSTLGVIYCPETNQVLFLNRQKKPWMGRWNGVGGKLNPGESALDCVIRETLEETGLHVPQYVLRGVLTWRLTGDGVRTLGLDADSTGGMYLFTAEVTQEEVKAYLTPRKADDEGILDWKSLEWITSKDNTGVPSNIPPLLEYLFDASDDDAFYTTYHDLKLTTFKYNPGQRKRI